MKLNDAALGTGKGLKRLKKFEGFEKLRFALETVARRGAHRG